MGKVAEYNGELNKMAKKSVFIINIGKENEDLYAVTIPNIKAYADKIDAQFIEIKEKKFNKFPFTYEKMQIYELGKNNDWNIYIDADYLIRDTLFDVTEVCPIDAIGQWGFYGASSWFEMDDVFKADTEEVLVKGETCERCRTVISLDRIEIRPRFIAFTDGFVVASKQCHEIWKPLTFPYETALYLARREHWLGEYTLARNLAQNHYKLYTFKTEVRLNGGQSDDSELLHINVTTKNMNINQYVIANCSKYLNKERDNI